MNIIKSVNIDIIEHLMEVLRIIININNLTYINYTCYIKYIN